MRSEHDTVIQVRCPNLMLPGNAVNSEEKVIKRCLINEIRLNLTFMPYIFSNYCNANCHYFFSFFLKSENQK